MSGFFWEQTHKWTSTSKCKVDQCIFLCATHFTWRHYPFNSVPLFFYREWKRQNRTASRETKISFMNQSKKHVQRRVSFSTISHGSAPLQFLGHSPVNNTLANLFWLFTELCSMQLKCLHGCRCKNITWKHYVLAQSEHSPNYNLLHQSGHVGLIRTM